MSFFFPLRSRFAGLILPDPPSAPPHASGRPRSGFGNPTSANGGGATRHRLLRRGGRAGRGGGGGRGGWGSRSKELIRHESRRGAVVGQRCGDAIPAQLSSAINVVLVVEEEGGGVGRCHKVNVRANTLS